MKILEELKKRWLTIAFFITSLWSAFGLYQRFLDSNEEMLNTLKTTQQMALKSVIWNGNIPLDERASACDVYIAAGYNSFTKKECEIILEEGAEEGTFFNLGRSE